MKSCIRIKILFDYKSIKYLIIGEILVLLTSPLSPGLNINNYIQLLKHLIISCIPTTKTLQVGWRDLLHPHQSPQFNYKKWAELLSVLLTDKTSALHALLPLKFIIY